jgi:hypothetical protein
VHGVLHQVAAFARQLEATSARLARSWSPNPRGDVLSRSLKNPDSFGRSVTFRSSNQVLSDAAGRSFITFDDYAVAVIDELEHPPHVGRRFGVAY